MRGAVSLLPIVPKIITCQHTLFMAGARYFLGSSLELALKARPHGDQPQVATTAAAARW